MKILSIIPALGIALFLVSCSNKKEQEKTAVSTEVDKNKVTLDNAQMSQLTTTQAELVNEQSTLALTGKVSFDENKITKVFPLVGGNVIKVNVSLGDYVHRGQILATMRSGDISDIEKQYDVAQSDLQIARKNLDIAEELFKTNVYSEKELLNARNEFKKSNAELQKIKQVLKIYNVSDKNTDAEYNVLAPIDGYIVEKNVNENMEIRSDDASSMFTVSFLKSVWVLADVYESDLSKIKQNQDVDIITAAYPDRAFKGTISQIANLLDPQSKSLKVRVVLDNSEGLLKPEMFAKVVVYIKQPNQVISVPSHALVFDNNQYYVMVKKGANTFMKTPVKLGNSYKDNVYIKSGLEPGETIISSGALLVSNSAK